MAKLIDLTGQKFHRWTVLDYAGASKWRCRCECGTESLVTTAPLKSGKSKSCGCRQREAITAACNAAFIGKRFTRLTVVGRAPDIGNNDPHWHCVCDCGAKSIVTGGNLKRGSTQSCGCLCRERTSKCQRKHGLAGTPEYTTWKGIIRRCTHFHSVEYPSYGGRGITVCKRWSGISGAANFVADMGLRPSAEHSIDRIDNNSGYAPNNCRWATRIQQQNNMRSNVFVEIDGTILTVSQWARKLNISRCKAARKFKREASHYVPSPIG